MTKDTILLSIVSPVYQAENVIEKLVHEIEANVQSITNEFEIVLVEDCSSDCSWDKIEKIAYRNKRIKGIKLSKNFGQHIAITAGLKHVTGKWVVVMDCDLQDQPQEIIKLYHKALEGFDIVQASRAIRYDSFLKKISSSIFYIVFRYFSGINHDKTIANFGIYNKKVINAFNSFNEPMRSFPSIINWMGFSKTSINVEHAANSDTRKTSYTFRKLLKLGADVILSYSNKPLTLTINAGILISLIGFCIGLFYVLRYFINGTSVSGFTTIISSLWFLSGVIISSLGIVGIYISSIFDTVKRRPLFIIDQKLGFKESIED